MACRARASRKYRCRASYPGLGHCCHRGRPTSNFRCRSGSMTNPLWRLALHSDLPNLRQDRRSLSRARSGHRSARGRVIDLPTARSRGLTRISWRKLQSDFGSNFGREHSFLCNDGHDWTDCTDWCQESLEAPPDIIRHQLNGLIVLVRHN
jgi:hypothetical protein